MKVRMGYVSNSSSSSFVVAFPHKPKDVADLKQMMFGKQEWHYSGWGDSKEADISVQQIAENVFDKIKKIATKAEMVASLENGWFDENGSLPGRVDSLERTIDLNYSDPEDRKKIEKMRKEDEIEDHRRAVNIVDVFRTMANVIYQVDNPYFIVVEFCDNDGEAVEEHTDIFQRLEYIRTSYH